MRKQIKFITTSLSVAVLGIFIVIFIKILIFPSVEIRHIFHLAFPPEDLYEPIVVDDFKFYEAGFTKTYVLRPKYLDGYGIGILSEKQNIPWGYKFNGKIKAEFFWKDAFLFEETITSSYASGQADNKTKYYKNTYLFDFDVPLKGKHKDDISVKLTVLEPDENLKEYGDTIKLFIGVSAIP